MILSSSVFPAWRGGPSFLFSAFVIMPLASTDVKKLVKVRRSVACVVVLGRIGGFAFESSLLLAYEEFDRLRWRTELCSAVGVGACMPLVHCWHSGMNRAGRRGCEATRLGFRRSSSTLFLPKWRTYRRPPRRFLFPLSLPPYPLLSWCLVIKERGPLGEEEAVVMIQQFVSALEFVHGKRIIHRDLKPANLLLTPGNQRPFALGEKTRVSSHLPVCRN